MQAVWNGQIVLWVEPEVVVKQHPALPTFVSYEQNADLPQCMLEVLSKMPQKESAFMEMLVV